MKCFILLEEGNNLDLPEKFTDPFNYEPHPVCVKAVYELQKHLGTIANDAKGKMYGVLVVKNYKSEIGFLAAYSGNKDERDSHFPFVPQVFEITNEEGFFRKGEKQLNEINKKIKELKNSPQVNKLKNLLIENQEKAKGEIEKTKAAIKESKKIRKIKRSNAENNPDTELILAQLTKESQTEKSNLKKLKKKWESNIQKIQNELNLHLEKINQLKEERKIKSATLQKELFNNYRFLNTNNEIKNAIEIFEQTDTKVPPAGTGDCAAPKLLQYAFKHKLTPVAMAEFWWGPSPITEIRKHGYYYPSCTSKCKPLLGYMLKGIPLDDSLSKRHHNDIKIEIIYEDESLVVINKPEGLLSVPGKDEKESVYTRMQKRYPDATGPLLVHRLDMATSGLLIIAKTKEAHKVLQAQFLKNKIKKRYIAVLDGIIKEDKGTIDLPLRVDLDDRPRQLVCYKHGKKAITKWKVISRSDSQTRIYLYPITGRTHQLRVHAAHSLGLNTSIVGDELYGKKADRLHLHAEMIEFIHPVTNKTMRFKSKPDF